MLQANLNVRGIESRVKVRIETRQDGPPQQDLTIGASGSPCAATGTW